MKIKQVFVVQEAKYTYQTLFALSEDGDMYAAVVKPGDVLEKPEWFYVDPPTEDLKVITSGIRH